MDGSERGVRERQPERHRAWYPIPIGGGGVYAGPASIFLEENPIFRKKNAFLADFAAGFSQKIKQNPEGVVSAGELAPPSEATAKPQAEL